MRNYPLLLDSGCVASGLRDADLEPPTATKRHRSFRLQQCQFRVGAIHQTSRVCTSPRRRLAQVSILDYKSSRICAGRFKTEISPDGEDHGLSDLHRTNLLGPLQHSMGTASEFDGRDRTVLGV